MSKGGKGRAGSWRFSRRAQAIADGFRSAFESEVAADLRGRGIAYGYESRRFELVIPVRVQRAKCCACGESKFQQTVVYTPDFSIGELIVETKGRWDARDRLFALAMKEQHGTTDYRLLFGADNKLSKNSKTRYSEWCEKNEIKFAVGKTIPEEWCK